MGTALFGFVHKAFNVTYFSFSGVFSVFFGCMAVVAITGFITTVLFSSFISAVIGFVSAYYKWIIGGVTGLVILGMLGSKSDNKDGKVEERAEQGNGL